MFLGKPCLVNAQALADSLLLTVHRQAVLAELEQDNRFALRMLAGLSRRLHGLVHDVQAYALQSGVQRVVGYLLREQDFEAAPRATPARSRCRSARPPWPRACRSRPSISRACCASWKQPA